MISCRPRASIDELENAANHFCRLHWDVVKSRHFHNRHGPTADSKLPFRCVEVLYITTLLEDGFGFAGTNREIEIALEVLYVTLIGIVT